MKFWHFTYHWKFYITHPWDWISDFIRSLKFAFQRFYRGWDDSIIWSLDYYLSSMMPIWLGEIKKNKISTPMLDYEELGIHYDNNDPDNGAYWKAAHIEWQNILQLMIEGFESAKMLADSDLPIFQEAHAQYEWTGEFYKDFAKHNEIVKELGGYDRIKVETDALNESFENGMRLFAKYYLSLWT